MGNRASRGDGSRRARGDHVDSRREPSCAHRPCGHRGRRIFNGCFRRRSETLRRRQPPQTRVRRAGATRGTGVRRASAGPFARIRPRACSGADPVKILVATDQWFPDYRGGVARLATETSDRLVAAGHEVTVIAPKSSTLPRVEESARRRLLRVIPRNAFPRTVLDAPATWNAARRLSDRFDAVIGHNPSASVGAAMAHPEVPLVHVFHASPRREARIARLTAHPLRRVVSYPLEPVLAA